MAGETRPTPLWTQQVKAGKVYYLDVYNGREGKPYLSLSENKKDAEGNWQKTKTFYSVENLQGLIPALAAALAFLSGQPGGAVPPPATQQNAGSAPTPPAAAGNAPSW